MRSLPRAGARDFDYYSLKDRAMAEAAEYGLMLWDGKSKGTVNNVVNLARDRKPVVVYVAPMTERSLQVTHRKGRTLATYLHLSHPTGEKRARTVASPNGLLIVDCAGAGRPLGVEITSPHAVPLERLNQLLAELGEPPLEEQDYRPVRAA